MAKETQKSINRKNPYNLVEIEKNQKIVNTLMFLAL